MLWVRALCAPSAPATATFAVLLLSFCALLLLSACRPLFADCALTTVFAASSSSSSSSASSNAATPAAALTASAVTATATANATTATKSSTAAAQWPDGLTVLGAGSYGTALAMVVASKDLSVTLYARSAESAALMQEQRCNERYLPHLPFPASLQVTADFAAAVSRSRDILIVVPSSAFASTVKQLVPLLREGQRVAWATKGLSSDGRFLSTLLEEALAPLPFHVPLAVLSGPTFAAEMVKGTPTAIACAGPAEDEEFVRDFCQLLHTFTFRPYQGHDYHAMQLGGAVKNVIAIAVGISRGLSFGANASTALITRGLREMVRLGEALGCNPVSFMGLSGLGDLVLTCSNNESRNLSFGIKLGQGMAVDAALAQISQVVEGYHIVSMVHQLAQRHQVDMPICEAVYSILLEHKDIQDAARELLQREMTAE